jgi:hypothetical protein
MACWVQQPLFAFYEKEMPGRFHSWRPKRMTKV